MFRRHVRVSALLAVLSVAVMAVPTARADGAGRDAWCDAPGNESRLDAPGHDVRLDARGHDVRFDAPGDDARLEGPGLYLVSSLDAREEHLASGSADESARGAKNPAAMGALSFVVPGSGQLVQGEKRGYLYLLAELAFWAGFYVLDQQGLDERDDYEGYADDEWDYSAYVAWYEENCVGCAECGYECRPLAEYGTQEYYEDIGKYQTYWRWWNGDGDEGDIDWDEYSSDDLSARNRYWDMRDESNRHLRQARYLMTAAFLNHVVSGVDSFLSAKRDEERPPDQQRDIGLEFSVPDSGEGLTCALVARY